MILPPQIDSHGCQKKRANYKYVYTVLLQGSSPYDLFFVKQSVLII